MALLCHSDETQVQRGLRLFQLHVEALDWSLDGCAESREMAGRSMLTSKRITWAANQGRTTRFEAVSGLLRDFLADMWGGPHQTHTNEDINNLLRDQELRESTSKTASRMSRYQKIIFSGHFEKNGYKEVTAPHTEVSFGRNLNHDMLFEASTAIATDLRVDDVLQDNTFQTWTSQSIKRSYAESRLMTLAYERRDRTLVSKSWMTSLLPPRQVVLIRKTPSSPVKGFYILWNAGRAALAWPCKYDGIHVRLKPDVSQLESVILTGLEDTLVKVLPTYGASPLRCLVNRRLGKDVKAIGCQMQHGDPVPLMEWHHRRGFAGVDEKTLRILCGKWKAPALPVECQVEGQESDRLALQLVLKTEPKISPEDLDDVLHRRCALEDAVPEEPEEIDQAILDDVLQMKDRQVAQERKQESKAKAISAANRRRSLHKLVCKTAPHIGKSKARKHLQAVKKRYDSFLKKDPHVFSKPLDPATDIYNVLKPDGAKIFKDLVAQRFYVHHVDIPGSRKNFAWTRRGLRAAMAMTLQQAWAWETEIHGGECPLNAEIFRYAVVENEEPT